MTALEMKEIRTFMHALLLTDAFDLYCVAEAHLVTFAEFTIDGTLHPEFFQDASGQDTPASSEPLVRWGQLRSSFYSLIRGKRQPLSFRIVFQLSRAGVEKLIELSGSSLRPEEVHSLSWNCIFRDGSLLVTTGTSISAFTKERTLERAWDDAVVRQMQKLNLN
jgi:hypothetical protein